MSGQIATFLLVSAIVSLVHCLYLPQEDKRVSSGHHLHRDRSLQLAQEGQPRKRPFCNAFTGCGRKRSQLPALTGMDLGIGAAGVNVGGSAAAEAVDDMEESLGTLLDLSAEPAVEDLSRQIMSEAKLWEAIQEANMEIMRQRQIQTDSQDVNTGTNVSGQQNPRQGQLKCALPSCITI